MKYFPGLSWQAYRGGGQHELPDGLCHCHLQGRKGGPAGEYLHQGFQDQIPDSPRCNLRLLYLSTTISPDMLKNAPMFKNMMTRGRGGAPRGKSGILRAQAGAGGRGRGRGMSSDRGGGRGDRGGRGGDRCDIYSD